MRKPPAKREVVSAGVSLIIVLGIDISLLLLKAANIPGGSVSHTITRVVIFSIAALFVTGVVQLLVKSKSLASFSGTIGSHLTALGILGTFSGIFIGLYYFDVQDLKGSVPLLLEGMKVAFSTSIAGLVSSIGLRITHSFVVSISIEDDPFVRSDEEHLSVIGLLGDSHEVLEEIRDAVLDLKSTIIMGNFEGRPDLGEILSTLLSLDEFEDFLDLESDIVLPEQIDEYESDMADD